MNLDPKSIIQYINYAFIILVFLRAFVGFCRGTKKSIYYLIATLIVYLGGWFLMDIAVNALMNFDLSSYNLNFAVNGANYTVTTLGEFLQTFVSNTLFAGSDLSNTVIMALVTGIVAIVVRLVYFLILIILSDTILKIIFDIIWLFIRPKKVENEKGKKRRPKPKFLSRLGGFGIGAFKGVFLLLILFFLVGGIASIVSDLDAALGLTETTKVVQDEDGKYDVVLLGNSVVLLGEEEEDEPETQEKKTNTIDDLKNQYSDYLPYLEILTGYRNQTIPGKIYGIIKIDNACLDEYVFDKLFEISVDYENDGYKLKEAVQLRKDLKSLANAIAALKKDDPEIINNLMNGKYDTVSSATLKKAVDYLAELKVVRVVIPVAIEYVILSDTLKSNESLASFLEEVDINTLRKGFADVSGDFKKLGYAFVDVLDLINFGQNLSELNIFSLDPQLVQSIFDQISSLGIVETFTPIVIDLVMSTEQVKKSITDLGLNYDEVLEKVDSITDWPAEIDNIGKIAAAVLDLGIEGTDIKNLQLDSIDTEKVNALVDTIFNSKLINEALPIVVNVGIEKLKENENLTDIVSALNITKDTNWKEELKPLLNCALVFLKSGLLSSEEGEETDILKKIGNISDENIEEMAGYLAQSGIVVNGLNAIIKSFLNGDKVELLKDIEIQAFTDEEVKAGTAWTKDEISGIFLAAKALINSGILNGSDVTDTVKNLSDDTIDNIASNLTKSVFFKRNLSGIINGLVKSFMTGEGTLKIVALEESGWTKDELTAIFKSAKELLSLNILSGDITTSISALTDKQIDNLAANIAGSQFFTTNFGNIIDFALSSVDLGVKIEGLDEEGIWNRNEIATLLNSAKILMSYVGGDKQITDILTGISENEIDILMNSKIIARSISSLIKENTKVDEEGKPTGKFDLTIIKGVDKINDGEWEDTVVDSTVSFTLSGNVLTVTNYDTAFSASGANRFDIYVDGAWISGMNSESFDFTSLIGEEAKFSAMPEQSKITIKQRSFGEVRRVFNALIKVATGAIVDGTFDSNKLTKNLTSLSEADVDTVLDSVLITETIKSVIVDLDTREADGSGDTQIYIDEARIDAKGWKQEIKAMLKAVKFVIGEEADLTNVNIDVNKVLSAKGDDLDTMLGSVILTDTIIKTLYDQSNVNYLGVEKGTEGTIVIPKDTSNNYYKLDDDFWRDNGSVAGEVRKIFLAIQALFTKEDPVTHEQVTNIDFNNINADAILDLTDDGIDTVLASNVLAGTIRKYIVALDTRGDGGSGETTIYVNESNILGRHTWAEEIKSLLKAFKALIKPDAQGNYSLENASSIDINAVLAPANKTKFLNSVIISDTIIANLESNSEVYTRTNTDWYGTDGTNGELGKFIDAAELVLKNDSGVIDINNFSQDNLTNLTNNISATNPAEDEVGTLVASTVLRDTIVSHIYDIDSIKENIDATGIEDDAYWADSYADPSNPVAGEMRNLLTSFKIIIGSSSITSFSFSMETIMDKTEAEIRQAINGSKIISTTCAKTISDTLYNGSLNGMIHDPGEGERLNYVKNGQADLFVVFKNLDHEFGIGYDSFGYSSFQNAITCDSDAYLMSDILCESQILLDSFGKMFDSVISGNASLAPEVITKIQTNINTITTWANPASSTSTKEYGELALLFRALGSLNSFGGVGGTIAVDAMKDPLVKLNASKVLQPVVTFVLEKALSSVESWKKSPEQTLTPIEWNYEVELLVDVITFVQNDLGGNLSGITNAADMDNSALGQLIVYIARSRILDVSKINDIVQTALNASFSNCYQAPTTPVHPGYSSSNTGTMNVTIVNPVKTSATLANVNINGYTNANYDAFVSAWTTEASKLQIAIAQLNNIDFSELTSSAVVTNEGITEKAPIHAMRMIGRFLDKCEDTVTLAPSVSNVAAKYSVTKGANPTWEAAFVAYATIIYAYI